MLITSLFDLFYQNILATTWLEIIAVIFGLLSVWFAKNANILVFPTGIISVLIYVYICYFAQLYADMGINFFYFIMSVYGWYMWTRKDELRRVLPITWNTKKHQIAGIIATIIGSFIIFGILWLFKKNDASYMNSYVPYIDSFTTSIFLVGMFFMARKKIENWIYWIIGDLISVPLYFYKELAFTSFQYFVFLIIAVLGLIKWISIYKANSLNSKP